MTSDLFLQAKSLQQAGELVGAETAYRQLLQLDPESYKAYNNLGNVLEAQGRLQEAIDAYHNGVGLAPECFILHYNLGRALQCLGQLGPALLYYMQALQIEPESYETHFNLGNLLFDQGRYNSACDAYRRAIDCNPQCQEAYSNLGLAQYELKTFEKAAQSFRQALAIDPSSAVEYFHLAKCLAAMNQFDAAIDAYRESLECNPASSTTHAHLVMLLQSLGRDYDAERAFDHWNTCLPDDPVAEHLWASHTGVDVPERATDRYLETVFDDFASDFDQVLTNLQYCAPKVLLEKLQQHVPVADQSLDVLDAGCGTGLCGPVFRDHARSLVGVDLSIVMLGKAKLRSTYDDLFHQELTAFLQQHVAAFDLIVAADSLIYFGVLPQVLKAAAAALRPGGLLLANLEALHDPQGRDFVLHRHGRYSHALEYVGLSLQQAGLEIVELSQQFVRYEAAQKVVCHIVTARKAAGESR